MKRQRILKILSLLFAFYLFAHTPVLAKIYINEFSSATTTDDWVEFYNDGDTTIDLSIYKIIDTKGNIKNLEGSIPGKGFAILDWSNRIDKAGDTLKLIINNTDNLIEDQVSFGVEGPENAAPTTPHTLGRKPDGGGSFILLSQDSKGSTNDNSVEAPPPTSTPTSTPTKTPAPTRTPTPTKVPTPTKAPTPMKSVPTSTRSTSLPTAIPTSTSSVLGSSIKKASPTQNVDKRPIPTAILGAKDEDTKKENKVLVKNASVEKVSPPIFIYLMFVGGAICMAICGILIYQNRKKIA